MRTAIIGHGAIASYVTTELRRLGTAPALVVARPGRGQVAEAALGIPALTEIEDLPDDIGLVLDCAGHSALAAFGPSLLTRGIDLITVSAGAFADAALADTLAGAATAGGARIQVVAGSIGGLDALAAAGTGGLTRVSYRGRKPPAAWRGSPAADLLDLETLCEPADFFRGTARTAALEYPKNANVAAATALAGVGFDLTEVVLTADPGISRNRHEITADGVFGQFTFHIEGRPLPGAPGSSALAAMSMVQAVVSRNSAIWT
ncbi:aspartate dehydrogenase [Oceaniovalibus sp. ACAM 378]|uniref:aspartate dehydrogenase n=1 Tax=Oceaniovalibus sp. ACAM 378 TaxID=2599923 RepID=UPI0011DA9D1B|nr:aspartate dehydrogenase [Oceaniovalibus sp. ACAM 378]TYB88426.1 aspartate dehydrogenase [Oceaniovalibus sp. ACAM 378]